MHNLRGNIAPNSIRSFRPQLFRPQLKVVSPSSLLGNEIYQIKAKAKSIFLMRLV